MPIKIPTDAMVDFVQAITASVDFLNNLPARGKADSKWLEFTRDEVRELSLLNTAFYLTCDRLNNALVDAAEKGALNAIAVDLDRNITRQFGKAH